MPCHFCRGGVVLNATIEVVIHFFQQGYLALNWSFRQLKFKNSLNVIDNNDELDAFIAGTLILDKNGLFSDLKGFGLQFAFFRPKRLWPSICCNSGNQLFQPN